MVNNINYKIKVDIEESSGGYRYRYFYEKKWKYRNRESKNKMIIAILFNPSKADLVYNDVTIDNLTKYFLHLYDDMIVLNLFSFMSPRPKDLINTKCKYECKNWKKVMSFLNQNKNNDFFIGWGKDFNNVEKRCKEFIKKENKNSIEINETERQNLMKLAKSIDKSANKRKMKLEKFFKDNEMKDNIYCFYNKKGDKALHPSSSKYLHEWIYDKFFK